LIRASRLFLALLLFFPRSLSAEPGDLILVRITPQVVEQDQSVSWKQELSKVTKAGQPVVVNIDAAPLEIRVSVTPFVHGKNFFLVVQGDVKQRSASGRIHRSITVQSLTVPPGEAVAFFPLGRDPRSTSHQMVIRMQVESQDE
jgi:hypothetical protein